jgi:hypothetical protein
MEVYIVYRTARDRVENIQLWSIYDNEIESLRECNYHNSKNELYFYYTLSKQVMKLFEI